MSTEDIKTQVEKILGSFLILDEMQPEDWKWYNQATTQILSLINEARVEELVELDRQIAVNGWHKENQYKMFPYILNRIRDLKREGGQNVSE